MTEGYIIAALSGFLFLLLAFGLIGGMLAARLFYNVQADYQDAIMNANDQVLKMQEHLREQERLVKRQAEIVEAMAREVKSGRDL